MIELKGTYVFPNHKDLEFIDPKVEVDNVVEKIDPANMTIHVSAYIERNDDIRGSFYIEINPVPVHDLNYDSGELIQRVTERLNDFKTK